LWNFLTKNGIHERLEKGIRHALPVHIPFEGVASTAYKRHACYIFISFPRVANKISLFHLGFTYGNQNNIRAILFIWHWTTTKQTFVPLFQKSVTTLSNELC
jgi:hypothetical protein